MQPAAPTLSFDSLPPAMAAAGEQTAKRKNRVVVWAGGGGGGLLLLGGGAAGGRRCRAGCRLLRPRRHKEEGKQAGVPSGIRTRTEGKQYDLQQRREGSEGGGERRHPFSSSSSSTGGAAASAASGAPAVLRLLCFVGLAFCRGTALTLFLRPNLIQEQENSSFKHEQTQCDENPSAVSAPGADDPSATVDETATAQKSDFVRVQEKIIKESSLVRNARGEGEEDSLPAIVNKAVVVHESKIIQVVGEVPPAETVPTDGSGRGEEEQEEEGSPVAEGAEESSGEAGDSSVAEEEPHEVARPAKATEPTLPSLEVIQSPKRVVTAIKEEVFHGTGQKLGAEEAEMTWKESRMVVKMREKGVMDKMVVEMMEKGFSGNAQLVILVSAVFFTTLLAILLHHYSSTLLESSQHV